MLADRDGGQGSEKEECDCSEAPDIGCCSCMDADLVRHMSESSFQYVKLPSFAKSIVLGAKDSGIREFISYRG